MAGLPASATTIAVGEAPSLAMSMTYVAMAGTVALAMENAVAAQQRGQVVSGTATVLVLAKIIAAAAA
jgi:hypothetical protein